jgi:hypothetical protein
MPCYKGRLQPRGKHPVQGEAFNPGHLTHMEGASGTRGPNMGAWLTVMLVCASILRMGGLVTVHIGASTAMER